MLGGCASDRTAESPRPPGNRLSLSPPLRARTLRARRHVTYSRSQSHKSWKDYRQCLRKLHFRNGEKTNSVSSSALHFCFVLFCFFLSHQSPFTDYRLGATLQKRRKTSDSMAQTPAPGHRLRSTEAPPARPQGTGVYGDPRGSPPPARLLREGRVAETERQTTGPR